MRVVGLNAWVLAYSLIPTLALLPTQAEAHFFASARELLVCLSSAQGHLGLAEHPGLRHRLQESEAWPPRDKEAIGALNSLQQKDQAVVRPMRWDAPTDHLWISPDRQKKLVWVNS